MLLDDAAGFIWELRAQPLNFAEECVQEGGPTGLAEMPLER
jgi:hypothetical protein